MEEIVVADTGFVVALMNRSDAAHEAAAVVYSQQGRVLLTQTVLAEVAYLVGREAGTAAVVAFLRGLPASRFRLVALTDADVQRVADILDRCAGSRIDFVDATVMSIAERYGISTILTLDQRDFRLFQPVHCEYFGLLPELLW